MGLIGVYVEHLKVRFVAVRRSHGLSSGRLSVAIAGRIRVGMWINHSARLPARCR